MLIATVILTATLGSQWPTEASHGTPPAGTPAKATPLEVTLKPSALVRGTDIRIGDLVTFDRPGPLADQLGSMVFGNPPTFGFVRRITAAEIRNSLSAHRVDVSELKFAGATSVSVTSTFREVRVDELRDVADAVLTAALEHTPGEEIEFDLDVRNGPIRVPPGRRSLEFEARVRDKSINQTSATVDVTFLVDGVPDQKVALRYRLRRFQYVVKAAHSIRAGEILGPGNLSVVRETVSATRGYWANDIGQVQGLVARRDLQRGAMVSIHDGRQPAVIRKGQAVDVISRRGRVQIRTRAIALSDAAITEPVQLRHVDGKVFVATAYGVGTAVIGNFPAPTPANRPTSPEGGNHR